MLHYRLIVPIFDFYEILAINLMLMDVDVVQYTDRIISTAVPAKSLAFYKKKQETSIDHEPLANDNVSKFDCSSIMQSVCLHSLSLRFFLNYTSCRTVNRIKLKETTTQHISNGEYV